MTISTWIWEWLSALRTGRLLPCRKYSWYLFLLEAESNATGRIMSMKISNDSIGNRTRDLPVCNAVPQPTAPPRTLGNLAFSDNIRCSCVDPLTVRHSVKMAISQIWFKLGKHGKKSHVERGQRNMTRGGGFECLFFFVYSLFLYTFVYYFFFVYSCLFYIFVQVCRTLPSGENQIAVNKCPATSYQKN
jgi:hypothetical protein